MGCSRPNGTDRSVVAQIGRLGAVPSDGHETAPRDERLSASRSSFVDPLDEAPASPREGRWGWPSVAVVLAYLALGMIAYWSAILDLTGRLAGSNRDFAQSVWFIGWVPHAMNHWLNPFFSDAMYVPTGVNLAQNTASPLLGLLTYPISLLASPLVSANLLMVLAMPVSAAAAFLVLRRWSVWGPAAALGGAIYGFSPYMVSQGLGHVELIFLPVPPLIALTIEAILHRRGNPRWLGIQLGALIWAQYLISPEVMADVALLSIAALVCIAVGNHAAWRTMARDALEPLTIAIGVVAVALAYPLWMLLAGPQRYAGTFAALNADHYDLLSFVIPGRMQRVSFGLPSQWGGALNTNPYVQIEAGGYIGIPLLLVAAVLAWRSRHRARMQLTVVLLAVSGVLSLGSSLYVAGKATHIPLPFVVFEHLPMLNNIQPGRISFATNAFLAAAIAFGLDDWHLRQPRARRGLGLGGRSRLSAAGLLAAVTLVALVVSHLPSWPYVTPSTSALPAGVEQAIPPRDPVTLTYPYPPVLQPLLWQSADDYGFSLLGGYARHSNDQRSGLSIGAGLSASPIPMNPPELQRFLLLIDFLSSYGTSPSAQIPEAPITPRLQKATRTALLRYRVQVVLVDRTSGGALHVMKLFHDVLGPPNDRLNSYSLWVHVQRTLKQRATTPAVAVHGPSKSFTGSPVVSRTDAAPFISRAGR